MHRSQNPLFLAALIIFANVNADLAQRQPDRMPENPFDLVRSGQDQKKAVKVNDAIYLAYGFGNTFMVTTPAGNIVIDTSNVLRAPRAKELLKAESGRPVKYIILTHGHGDHTGGIPVWREPGAEIIAQKEPVRPANNQTRL